MKKFLAPKSKNSIAAASFSVDEKCYGCQYLQILLSNQITRIGFGLHESKEMLEISKNLRSFLEGFESSIVSERKKDLERRIKDKEEVINHVDFKQRSKEQQDFHVKDLKFLRKEIKKWPTVK